ncbi:hypothetical protein AB0K48_56900, partial [Nonomuraea sp. NPDC055795]
MRPLAAVLVVVLVAAGCASPRRDKITVACGASERWCAMMVKRFADATGVEADYVRLSSGEALPMPWHDAQGVLARVTQPVLGIWGAHDLLTP